MKKVILMLLVVFMSINVFGKEPITMNDGLAFTVHYTIMYEMIKYQIVGCEKVKGLRIPTIHEELYIQEVVLLDKELGKNVRLVFFMQDDAYSPYMTKIPLIMKWSDFLKSKKKNKLRVYDL